MRDQRLVKRIKQEDDADERFHVDGIAWVRVEVVVRLQARHTVQSERSALRISILGHTLGS